MEPNLKMAIEEQSKLLREICDRLSAQAVRWASLEYGVARQAAMGAATDAGDPARLDPSSPPSSLLAREASRSVAVPIQSTAVGADVVADNWGDLFDRGDNSNEQRYEEPIIADNWGGLFEQPAHLLEEHDVEFSAALPFAVTSGAAFSFTDGAAPFTELSSDPAAVRAKSDAVEQEVRSAGNMLREGELLFPDTTKQIDLVDLKELASLGNDDSRVHSADADDSVFPFSEGAYTQTAALGSGHACWWPTRRTTEYCSGTPYFLQRASTDPWVAKNGAHKLFGEMPTSDWRSPSHVLEVTVRQELQPRNCVYVFRSREMSSLPCSGSSGKEDKSLAALSPTPWPAAKAAPVRSNSRASSSRKEDSVPVCRGGNTAYGPAQIFTFRKLAIATKNFRKDCLLGEGGFGRVYKGHMENGQVIAVKQLDRNGFQGNREFLVEVLMLSLLHHPNLVRLIGYCADGDQRLLVYEYMLLGSLENRLFGPAGKEPLDWNTRMKIAAGAAKGLEYLHDKANPPVIYRDFKSSNILLGEDYYPKLSDFGLAKLGPVGDKTHVSTRVMGTYGYCAPEYAMTGQLTLKSDVYSFGVVFLELITGRKAIDHTQPSGEQNLVAWARPLFRDRRKFCQLADPLLHGRYPKRGLYQALAVAAMCLQEQAASRPLIGDVVTALSYLAAHPYDPNAPSTKDSKTCPSTPRAKTHRRTTSVPDAQHAAESLILNFPDMRKEAVRGGEFEKDRTEGSGSSNSSSGRNDCLDVPQLLSVPNGKVCSEGDNIQKSTVKVGAREN